MESPDVDKIQKITELIAKRPIAFVGAVFFFMFWGFFIWSQHRIDDQTKACEQRFERVRREKEDLVTALLIKNNVISNLKEEKQRQDSIMKNKTIDETEKLLRYGK